MGKSGDMVRKLRKIMPVPKKERNNFDNLDENNPHENDFWAPSSSSTPYMGARLPNFWDTPREIIRPNFSDRTRFEFKGSPVQETGKNKEVEQEDAKAKNIMDILFNDTEIDWRTIDVKDLITRSVEEAKKAPPSRIKPSAPNQSQFSTLDRECQNKHGLKSCITPIVESSFKDRSKHVVPDLQQIEVNNVNEDSVNAGNLTMQQSFMRAARPQLPDFHKNDVDTWLDICNKKFDDFDIDDPMIKYQMITSVLGTDEINRMAPYMSRGNRNEYYDNFVTGLIKVFGTTRRQKFRQAQEVKFSADDLPSTLANKLRTTLPVKDFSNEAIIDFVRDKFSDELCFLMTPYDHLDWEEYLGMADKY